MGAGNYSSDSIPKRGCVQELGPMGLGIQSGSSSIKWEMFTVEDFEPDPGNCRPTRSTEIRKREGQSLIESPGSISHPSYCHMAPKVQGRSWPERPHFGLQGFPALWSPPYLELGYVVDRLCNEENVEMELETASMRSVCFFSEARWSPSTWAPGHGVDSLCNEGNVGVELEVLLVSSVCIIVAGEDAGPNPHFTRLYPHPYLTLLLLTLSIPE
ncbi:PREDICTED: uncharacterized protein LOC105500286 [Colobus angolensis palliatus]|uniref:uncharacterized protein LOC105500286 n=1 Tax=Colobus angolensis palliatus TaxID=336983 RepID=UPI0005F41CA2|nr:PREDICTED: uncharacterized protein LOC105500286 [Colobus angolensis palliatus]